MRSPQHVERARQRRFLPRAVVIATDELPWIAIAPGRRRTPSARPHRRRGRARHLACALCSREFVFPAHDHALGEEFLVLDGVFSDEHGDYPARNLCAQSAAQPPHAAHRARLHHSGQASADADIRTNRSASSIDIDARAMGATPTMPGLGDAAAVRWRRMRQRARDAGAAGSRRAPGRADCRRRRGDLRVVRRPRRRARDLQARGTWIRNPAGFRARSGIAERSDLLGEARSSAPEP